MASSPRRFLFLPHPEIDGATVIRAAAPSDDTPQEAGLTVRQPSVSTAPKGDIRPTLSGVPEVAAAGEVTLNLAGPLDIARYGWVRDGDDDLQLRQSPMVCGRRPDVVRRRTSGYTNRPKLLPLKSGKLLLLWMEADRPAPLLPGSPTGIPQWSRYEPENPSGPQWTGSDDLIGPNNRNGPSTAGAGMGTAARVGIDAVQFPDTGEIVCFVPVQDSNLTPTDRRLYVYHSVDDGDTWIERARAFAQGTKPSFEFKTTAGAADSSPMQCIAAELLDSGRIVVFISTARGLYSLTSDDRGSTWTRTTIQDDESNYVAPDMAAGTTVACGKMRNGAVLLVSATTRSGVSGTGRRYLRVTVDGTRFGAAINLYSAQIEYSQEYAVTMRPDGWPALYACMHDYAASPAGAPAYYTDWLMHGSIRQRDPAMHHTSADLMPPLGLTAFHCTESAGSAGNYPYVGGTNYKLHGFVSLDAVNYRGQVVIAAQVARDNGSESSPVVAESAIVIYRLNHWQPARERLAPVTAADVRYTSPPIRGRVYNRTWDCYGVPEQWGFAAAGAGTGTIEPASGGGSEGAYLKVSTGSSTRNYSDTSLPNDSAGRYGVVRAVLRVQTGGSLSSDRAALKLALDNGSAGVGFEVRFARGAFTTSIAVYDQVSGGQLGSTITVPNDRWIEVLGGINGNSAIVIARADEGEADWDAPYQTVCDTTMTAGSVSDELTFGHFATGSTETWWKTVQLHRPAESFPFGAAPLSIPGSTFKDEHTLGDLSTSGEGLSAQDAGVVNVMRCSQATALPSQYLTRGLHVAWKGEATTEGAYDFATAHDYGADALFRQPVMKEWRSVDDGKAIEIVLDAGASGVRFHPEALAIFGRNVPGLTVELNDSDSWGSPSFSWSYGWPGSATSAARYTHLWAYDASDASGAGWKFNVYSGRLAVFPPAGNGPWRPHQFRSQATGPKFYWVVNQAGTERVYRIKDNGPDWLTFETPPALSDVATIVSESSYIFDSDWAIFSDRFAAKLEHKLDGTHIMGGVTYPALTARGWRYLRLLFPAVTHMDADEQFTRAGRVVLGRAIELTLPDAQWGWAISQDSGQQVSDTDTGATFARRRTSPRRTFRFDYAALMPATEASDPVLSPNQQPAKKSWQAWMEAMRRLEVDGLAAALVWEGDRATDVDGGDAVQMAADPLDLMMVRVTSAGSVEHVGYDNGNINLASGAACVPRPICVVKGITFREEF